MEKIKSIEYRTLFPFYFYIDEIKELVHLFSETTGDEVEIKACDYKIDNLDELKSLPADKIHELSITSKKPNILISLAEENVRIEVLDKYSLELQGLVTKMENVFLENKRHFIPVLQNSLLSIFYPVILILLFLRFLYLLGTLSVSKEWELYAAELTIEGFLIIVLLSCGAWEFYLRKLAFSTIQLDFRKNIPSFWKRNRDKLFVGLICSVLGTLMGVGVTFLGQFLFTRRSPSTLPATSTAKREGETSPILGDEDKPDTNAPSVPVSQNDPCEG